MDQNKSLNGLKRAALKRIIASANSLQEININNYFCDLELFHRLVVSLADATNEIIILNNSISKE